MMRPFSILMSYFATAFLIWYFWDHTLLYPFKLFVVFLHEISHGIAAYLTGGRVIAIHLSADEGGQCLTQGGSPFVILFSGYLGSLLWGCLILLASRHHRYVNHLSTGLGVSTLLLGIIYVRNGFAISFTLFFSLLLMVFGKALSPGANRLLIRVIGLSSCLYAIYDIKNDILDRPDLPSDAYALAQLTHVPTVLWGVLWLLIALTITTLLLKWIVFQEFKHRQTSNS